MSQQPHSLFPVLPELGSLKADVYLWAAAFGGVLLAIFLFTSLAPLIFGGQDAEDFEEDADRESEGDGD